ncbi:hypothetical protein KQI41_12195 [Tissierella pigra]|uniref:hypothetical protein n=1 Tax=Tissierella pigra TaxID=2607614 RepID=UPI001C125228|nr:hypothetical protein [Tissierella pigra]MBU5427177.1 hypothetical protein [Tissierella pigra]
MKIDFLHNKLHNTVKNKCQNIHDSYILDSNIVIKLRSLYYNPESLKNDFDYIKGLWEFFEDKDVLPDFGIRELSWDFSLSDIDVIKYNRMLFAMEGLFEYHIDTIKRIESKKKYINNKFPPVKRGEREFCGLIENMNANPLLLPTFCFLYKFYKEISVKPNEKFSIEVYNEMIRFTIEDLRVVLSYKLIFIIYLLFSEDDEETTYIEKMLKINKEQTEEQKIWNSSWDIFLLRIINEFAVQTLNGISNQNI